MLSVTDRLAVMRTELANERTLLAYVRTALALAAGGVATVQFVADPRWRAAGWALIPLGGVALLVGIVRYRQAGRALAAVETAHDGDH